MKGYLVFVVTLALVSVSSAYGQDRNLRIVVPQEPPELEICSMGSSAPARVLFGNVGEGLTQRDPVSGAVLPLLALEWKQTSPTSWVFKLREGVTFHDGSPFNAETAVTSFVRTFKKELSCASATQAFGSLGVSAKALGPYEIELTTTQPDPILPLRISFVGMTGPKTDPNSRTNQPVGTGPYQVTKWQRGTDLVLQPFKNYWGKSGAADRVTYIFRSEDLVRAEMIGTGEADIAVGLPAEFAKMKYAVSYPVPETTGLRFHMQSPPFNDRRVREAVVYALDREGLIAAIWNGVGKSAGQPITEDVLGFNPDIKPAPYDPKRAKQLIAEAKAAGVAVNTPSKIFTRLDVLDNADLLAQAIAQQLNDIGMNVSVEVMEAAPWIDLLRIHPKDRPGFLLEPHNNLLGDASWTANSKYHSKAGRSQNRGETAAVADAMIEKAGAATGEERRRLYRELMTYLSQEVMTDAFIAYTNAVLLVGPKVSYTPNTMSNDIVRVSEVTFRK